MVECSFTNKVVVGSNPVVVILENSLILLTTTKTTFALHGINISCFRAKSLSIPPENINKDLVF